MKDTIRDILRLQSKGSFRNEQHVRFSFVARIREKQIEAGLSSNDIVIDYKQ